MKKNKISVAALLMAGGSLLFSSCIGSFSLTNSVISWNKEIGHKFVNELVFVAFWILPVYEVTALADLLVLNSIEFWTGDNPLEASTKIIDTDHGRYLVICDGTGYTIKLENSDLETRINFDIETETWSLEHDGVSYPFMTYLDENHVKMITPEGDMSIIELSSVGLQAYKSMAQTSLIATR